MALPLAATAPAALLAGVAGIAWLTAKTQLYDDLVLLSGAFRATIQVNAHERCDRMNLFYVLEKHATSKRTSSRSFLAYNGKEWTFREVYDLVLKYGTWLKKTYAIAPKEVVAMDFMNSANFVFFWLAIWSVGACPAFLNYNLTGQPLLHCIKTSTARIVLVDEEIKAQFTPEVLQTASSPGFRDRGGPVQVVIFDGALEQQILAVEARREPDLSRSGVKAHEMSCLIYTSGTTGLPKPAIVSWHKATVSGIYVSRWLRMKPSDIFYTCMPLYHASAALLGFCICLMNGSTLVIGHKFSARHFWPEVRASNATIIQYVGETCRYLLSAPPQFDPTTGEGLDRKNSVRIAFGNGLRPDIWNRFKERFDIDTIAEFYAATEAPQGSWNFSSNDWSLGAIGRNGVLTTITTSPSVAIVEVDWETELPLRFPENHNFCKRVLTGAPGELLFKIDPAEIAKRFQGYLNNTLASDKKILRDALSKGDAWFRTGDVVRWDAEGRWYFCDRIGDTFRWKSENVSTAEVSEALGRHPAIQEANVYGVEIPHHDGRAGCAAVVFSKEVNPALLSEVATHAKEHLPRYAVPLFLRVTSKMQATGNNKQQKHVLKAQGVEPATVRAGGDKVFWLRGGTYAEFRDGDWQALVGKEVRL